MLINEKAANARLTSPMNLMNRLNSLSNPRKTAMSLFIPPKVDVSVVKQQVKEDKILFNPFENKNIALPTQVPASTPSISAPAEPTIDNLIENHDAQVKLGLAHDKALTILNDAMSELSIRLSEVKAEKLPAVITSVSKVVEGIRRERIESKKNDKDKEVHYHFYTPQQKKVSDYEIIDVQAS
jgi:hypothetical protein